MQTIEYRILYVEGETEIAQVQARNINSGFRKALRVALEPLGNGTRREIYSILFWQVKF